MGGDYRQLAADMSGIELAQSIKAVSARANLQLVLLTPVGQEVGGSETSW